MKNHIIWKIGTLLSILVAFIFGASLGGKYALINDLKTQEHIIITNLPLIYTYSSNACNEESLEYIISLSNAALIKHAMIEPEINTNILSQLGHGIFPIVYFLYYDDEGLSNKELESKLSEAVGSKLKAARVGPN